MQKKEAKQAKKHAAGEFFLHLYCDFQLFTIVLS